jgi:hypothetical protein
VGHSVYSFYSKESGSADPSSAGFTPAIEKDRIDACRSPHFKRRRDHTQGRFAAVSSQTSLWPCITIDLALSLHPLTSVRRVQFFTDP